MATKKKAAKKKAKNKNRTRVVRHITPATSIEPVKVTEKLTLNPEESPQQLMAKVEAQKQLKTAEGIFTEGFGTYHLDSEDRKRLRNISNGHHGF